jgi:hypothetical protein
MNPSEHSDAQLLWKMFYAGECFRQARGAAQHILDEKLERDSALFYPLVTAVYVLYAKPFTRADAVGKLGDEIIPAEHRELHSILLEHRHQLYAHRDALKTSAETALQSPPYAAGFHSTRPRSYWSLVQESSAKARIISALHRGLALSFSRLGFLPNSDDSPAMSDDMIDPAELEAHNRWLEDHLDEVCRKYPGRYIAVYRNEVVAVGDSYPEVYRLAHDKGVPDFPFVMAVPRPEEMAAAIPSVFYPGS